MYECWNTHNPQRIRLDQRRLGELNIAGVRHGNAFARHRLQDRPVVEALVVRVRVQIRQRLAVKRCVAEPNDDLRLDVIDALVAAIERVLQVVGHLVVERFREQPSQRRTLMGLWVISGLFFC